MSTEPPTLYLIDGYAQFFRAYHAIRNPMTSPVTKEPTNMTFGFVGMLLKLLRGEGRINGPPQYVACTLDVSGDHGTFRSQLYPEYKATRDAPPEDLHPQVERCIALMTELGIPILGAEGFEADDVIATLVRTLRDKHPDLRIRVISKDKDLKQLLETNHVELYDIHHDTVIDESALEEESGIKPSQVIDMLALMGDNVDNVPGVEGVGPKTAAQLVAKYGSLDELLAHADEIKGKRGEKIRAAGDLLKLSRQLVTLRDDADVSFDLDDAKVGNLELSRLGPILRELGFNRYQEELKQLLGEEDTPAPRSKPADDGGLFSDSLFASEHEEVRVSGDYWCVKTKQELDDLVQKLNDAPFFAVDTETTALDPYDAKLAGLSFSVEPGSGWYVPIRTPDPSSHLDEQTVLDALRPVLEDPTKPKIGHNLKYDLLILRYAGVELRGLTRDGGGDTMVASYLIDASRSSHKMDYLAQALLQRRCIPITDLIGSGKKQKSFDQVPLDQASAYAAEDADVTLQLANEMFPQLRELDLSELWHDVESPLVEVLAELEWNGIRVDPDILEAQRDKLAGRIDELKTQIQDEAFESIGRTFDPDSPKQLSGALFNKPDAAEPGLGIKPRRKTKTGYSTDAEVLEKLSEDPGVESPIPSLILEYRQLTKLVNTYLVALKEYIKDDGRIHASFNQTVAATGRLSSSDPNLQNIPIRSELGREIRRAFVAEPGNVLITADYSQIELRLLAHLSKDPALIDAFLQGEDIHTTVAAQVHSIPIDQVTKEQRSGAKMVNFGIVYGVTPFGLARRLGVSNSEAEEIITGYKKRFAGITTFLQECVEQAQRNGYVETMLKRRRPILDIESNSPSRRALGERTAINSVVQGSAADLIKVAMVDLHARLSPHAAHLRDNQPPAIDDVRMLLQIHDELVFECPEDRAEQAKSLIVERMEQAFELSVPLKVDASISRDWYEGK